MSTSCESLPVPHRGLDMISRSQADHQWGRKTKVSSPCESILACSGSNTLYILYIHFYCNPVMGYVIQSMYVAMPSIICLRYTFTVLRYNKVMIERSESSL